MSVVIPFGLALAAVLPRELAGTLALLIVIGLQMVMDPANGASRVLPFWFSREIGTYAIDHTDGGYLTRGLVHGVLFAVVFSAIVVIGTSIRLRRRGHLRFVRTSPSR